MRAPNLKGDPADFTAEEVMNRVPGQSGPLKPGIGLAQWSTKERRAGLFTHTYRGVRLGSGILYNMDAEVDYMVSELSTRPGFAGVQRVLTNPSVTVEQASDEVLMNFERPKSVLSGKTLLPRTDPRVIKVLGQRRPGGLRAERLYRAATSAPAP